MAAPAHIVVIRFSAMGDVALLAPVLQSAASQNPDIRLTLVTRPKFSALFSNLKSINIFSADVDHVYNGLLGLWRLASAIRSMKPSAVVDVHDHLRTKILGFLLRLSGIKVIVFDKGRKEKQSLIRIKNKNRSGPLLHTCERYRLALVETGLTISQVIDSPLKGISEEKNLPPFLVSIKNKRLVGIAPFAAHFTKMWPLEKFRQVIKSFAVEKEIIFLLFGGGEIEKQKLKSIASEFSNCVNVSGQLSLQEELSLMSRLEVMVCVDSSNMHLASLSGIPVLSVWGGTHTDTGFGPVPDSRNRIIEIPVEDMACRPCSVYGLSKCPRNDHACMQQISPESVTTTLREMLNLKPEN